MTKIEHNVMAAVRAIYIARQLTNLTALKCYALILSIAGLVTLVSIANVSANFAQVAQGGVEAVFVFLMAAVIDTDLIVQASLALGMTALGSLLIDLRRMTSSSSGAAAA